MQEEIASTRALIPVTARPGAEPRLRGHPHPARPALSRLGREAGIATIARLAEERSVPAEVAIELILCPDA